MRTVVLVLVLNMASFALSPAEKAKVKRVAREYITDHLKAPATAIFSKETVCAPLGNADFEEAKGTGPTPECTPQSADKVGNGDDSIVYRASVDAQNSYGALIRTKYRMHVYVVTGKWEVLDMAETVSLLKEACDDLYGPTTRGNRPLHDCKAEYPNAR